MKLASEKECKIICLYKVQEEPSLRLKDNQLKAVKKVAKAFGFKMKK